MRRKLSNYVRFAARDVAQPVTRGYPHVTVETELRKKGELVSITMIKDICTYNIYKMCQIYRTTC